MGLEVNELKTQHTPRFLPTERAQKESSLGARGYLCASSYRLRPFCIPSALSIVSDSSVSKPIPP